MAFLRVATVFLAILAVFGVSDGRKLDQCQFVRELRSKPIMPADQIATWSCIAYHESRYDTGLTSPVNRDGSRDHGIFQINDRYWCSPPNKGKGCGVSCDELKTDDFTEAAICARKIWVETKNIQKNGFKAWTTYKFCDTPDKVAPFVKGC